MSWVQGQAKPVCHKARPADEGGGEECDSENQWEITFSTGFPEDIAEPVEADGTHFAGESIDLDPDLILDRILEELDASTVLDLAIQGSPDGRPVYDARVRGSRGGILLVLLGPDGAILGVQAE